MLQFLTRNHDSQLNFAICRPDTGTWMFASEGMFMLGCKERHLVDNSYNMVAVDIAAVWHYVLNFAVLCYVSLQGMVAVCSHLVLMRKMMRKQMPFMILLIEEWMIGEKREGNYKASKKSIKFKLKILKFVFSKY